jgi:hypothetical protein
LHALTLHKSEKNLSDKPRCAFLPSYHAADAYPIYVSNYTSDSVNKKKLVRGERSNYARCEAATWLMPHPEKIFNSLYEIQEGSHLHRGQESKTGYYGKNK